MLKSSKLLNNLFLNDKIRRGSKYSNYSLKINKYNNNIFILQTFSVKKNIINQKINKYNNLWFKINKSYKKKLYNYFQYRRLFFSQSWWTYIYDYKLNYNNKKQKYTIINKKWKYNNYYNIKNLYKGQISNIYYNNSIIFYKTRFNNFTNYINNLIKTHPQKFSNLVFTNILFNINIININRLIIKYNLFLNIFIKLTNYKILINFNLFNLFNRYKLIFNFNKYIFNNKIKIIVNYFNTSKLKYNNNNFNIIYKYLIFKFKFLWRNLLTINLIKLYIYLLITNNINNTSNYINEYFKNQFRVLFSKQDQKHFLFLILKFNKFIINNFNNYKYKNYNNLNYLQIIITGRWQRKRWVTPFPLTYKAGLLEFNKIFKNYNKKGYKISYNQKTIFTKKGNIGLRVFLLYKLNI